MGMGMGLGMGWRVLLAVVVLSVGAFASAPVADGPPAALDAVGLAPPVAVAAECEGDSCQSPPPPPSDPVPGTAVVVGPSNPPVRFPSQRSKPKKGKPKKGKSKKGNAKRNQGKRRQAQRGRG